MTAVLDKQNAVLDQNKLIGRWSGFSRDNGQSALFQVVSVDGRDAQVRFAANGGAIQSGVGNVAAVMFGRPSRK